jgi:hypothetical protein
VISIVIVRGHGRLQKKKINFNRIFHLLTKKKSISFFSFNVSFNELITFGFHYGLTKKVRDVHLEHYIGHYLKISQHSVLQGH